MKFKLDIENKPFAVCIMLSIISMRYFSAVLMITTLLLSAILAMNGFRKPAIYSSILSVLCGVFGIASGKFINGLKEKYELLIHYPSLVDNPAIVIKLYKVFNIAHLTQIAIILIFLILNIIIIKMYEKQIRSKKHT